MYFKLMQKKEKNKEIIKQSILFIYLKALVPLWQK